MNFLILFQAMLARVTKFQMGVFATCLAVQSGFRAFAEAHAPMIDAKKETNRSLRTNDKKWKKSQDFWEVLAGGYFGEKILSAKIERHFP